MSNITVSGFVFSLLLMIGSAALGVSKTIPQNISLAIYLVGVFIFFIVLIEALFYSRKIALTLDEAKSVKERFAEKYATGKYGDYIVAIGVSTTRSQFCILVAIKPLPKDLDSLPFAYEGVRVLTEIGPDITAIE